MMEEYDTALDHALNVTIASNYTNAVAVNKMCSFALTLVPFFMLFLSTDYATV